MALEFLAFSFRKLPARTYILIAEPLHAAVEEAGLADGYGQVARHIKVEVGQQVRGRDGGGRRRGRRGRNRRAVAWK